MPIVIIIAVADELAATIFDALRPIGTESNILLTQEETDNVRILLAILLQHFTGIVGGTIIANDNFNVGIYLLCKDALDRLAHCIRTVVGWDNGRY